MAWGYGNILIDEQDRMEATAVMPPWAVPIDPEDPDVVMHQRFRIGGLTMRRADRRRYTHAYSVRLIMRGETGGVRDDLRSFCSAREALAWLADHLGMSDDGQAQRD